MLNQSKNGGMVVSQVTREDITELYELREALEVYAVSRVASRPMVVADRVRLQKLIDEIGLLQKELRRTKKDVLDHGQMKRFITCDLGFHALLMSMTNNARLQKIINDTRLLISIFAIHRRGHDLTMLKSIQLYHQQILDAVIHHKPDVAMAALAEHIRASERERLSEYDHWRREASLKQSVPAFFDIHQMDNNQESGRDHAQRSAHRKL